MESVDEIAAKIAALGPAYTEYAQRVCDNAVDGEMIAEFVAEGTLNELFAELSIISKMHCVKLRKLFASGPLATPRSEQPVLNKMTADVPTMVFGETRVYRYGLSGRLGKLTRSVLQEFDQNESGKWRGELDYVLGAAREAYPATKGVAPVAELVQSYTRDLGHTGWTVRRFWEAQPAELRGARGWLADGRTATRPAATRTSSPSRRW